MRELLRGLRRKTSLLPDNFLLVHAHLLVLFEGVASEVLHVAVDVLDLAIFLEIFFNVLYEARENKLESLHVLGLLRRCMSLARL